MKDNVTNNSTNGGKAFAIVPESVIACQHLSPSDFKIVVHGIRCMHIKPDNGQPFTHSVASISKATGLSVKTVSRRIQYLTKKGIYKPYGKLKHFKEYYTIYTFAYDALEKLTKDKMSIVITNDALEKLTKDKMSIVITNEIKEIHDVEVATRDNMSDKMTPRSNIIEVRRLEERRLEESTSTSTGSNDLLKEMERELSTDFYRKSECASIVSGSVSIGSGASFKSTKSKFQVPYGIDDKLPSSTQLQGKSSTRPFAVVFTDPVLRPELQEVIKQGVPSPKDLEGLSYQEREQLKEKYQKQAIQAFCRKHRLDPQ